MKIKYTKQEQRESIMLCVASLIDEINPSYTEGFEKLETIDALVCESLGIDSIDNPPLFLLHP